jgi:hypothetical protein
MSPHTFRCAIHYKEAVRETLRMDYYSGLWRREAARRLCTFQGSVNAEKKARYMKEEQDTRLLLNILVEREALPAAIADVEYLTAARDDQAKALNMADAELKILHGQLGTENEDCTRSGTSRVVDM